MQAMAGPMVDRIRLGQPLDEYNIKLFYLTGQFPDISCLLFEFLYGHSLHNVNYSSARPAARLLNTNVITGERKKGNIRIIEDLGDPKVEPCCLETLAALKRAVFALEDRFRIKATELSFPCTKHVR